MYTKLRENISKEYEIKNYPIRKEPNPSPNP